MHHRVAFHVVLYHHHALWDLPKLSRLSHVASRRISKLEQNLEQGWMLTISLPSGLRRERQI